MIIKRKFNIINLIIFFCSFKFELFLNSNNEILLQTMLLQSDMTQFTTLPVWWHRNRDVSHNVRRQTRHRPWFYCCFRRKLLSKPTTINFLSHSWRALAFPKSKAEIYLCLTSSGDTLHSIQWPAVSTQEDPITLAPHINIPEIRNETLNG